MSDPIPMRRPINWARLRMDEAERVVRERVRDTDNVRISMHALERLGQRSGAQLLTTEDIYVILETGMVNGPPVLEDGEWKVVVVKRMAGMREAGAVTLFVRENDLLFVKTVEWMD